MPVYSDQKAFELYQYYLALKQHFTSKYDFFKYNGKVSAKFDTFQTRKDKFSFYKLSNKPEAKDYILANVVTDPKIWAGNFGTDDCDSVYTNWLKRQQSMSYRFKEDINNLGDDFDSQFKVVNGQHPPALKAHISNNMSLESLVILDDLLGCMKYWSGKISDNILFPNINNNVSKYRPFVHKEGFDIEKYKEILLDKYENIL